MNPIRASLDAIRAALHEAYPALIIYVNDVPQDFKRPSFFVALINAPSNAMAADLRNVRPTWQLVYFPPLLGKATLSVDKFDLYDMHDKLLTLFGEPMYLLTPDRKALDIEAFDGAPRDDAGYYTLRLDAQHWVRRPDSELTQNVTLDINMKE